MPVEKLGEPAWLEHLIQSLIHLEYRVLSIVSTNNLKMVFSPVNSYPFQHCIVCSTNFLHFLV